VSETVKKIIQLFIPILFLTILLSCSTDPEPIKGPEQNRKETIVADITKVIDQDTRNKIIAIDTSNFTFTFNGETDVIKNLKVGDILVDSSSTMAPNGYLRKIVAIEGSSGQKTIRTEQGKLSEAVTQASIRYKSGILNKRMLKSYSLAKGVTLSEGKRLDKKTNTNFNVFEFEFEKEIHDPNQHAEKISLSGFASLDMEFILEFDWSFALDLNLVEVDLFKSAVAIDQVAQIQLKSENGAGFFERVSFAKLEFTPWTFTIGPVPVVLVPQIELFMEVDGTISANLTTWASEHYHGEIGLKYTSDDGWNGIGESKADLDYSPPSLTLSANFQTHVGPEVKVLLYGVAGPTMDITGCYELDATLLPPYSWNLEFNIGARARAGVELYLLGFEKKWNTEIFCYTKNLFKLANEPFGNEIHITNPLNNRSLILGNPVTITADVVGEAASKVEFYIDHNLVSTDTEKPYEYVWETNSSSEGNHTIEVKEYINGTEISKDNITIRLSKANWTTVELTNITGDFISPEYPNFYNVHFVNSNDGWMFGTGGTWEGGVILKTNNGGNTWNAISEPITATDEVLFQSTQKLIARRGMTIWSSGDGGSNFIEYGYYDNDGNYHIEFPTETFGIATNNNGDLVTVGEVWLTDSLHVRHSNLATHQIDRTQKIDCTKYRNGTFPQIYFKGNFGIIYNVKKNDDWAYLLTSDGGYTWTSYAATFYGEDFVYGTGTVNQIVEEIFFLNENTGWLVGGTESYGGSGFISKTTDGGLTWTNIDIGIQSDDSPFRHNSISSVHFINANEGYMGLNAYSTSATPTHKLFHTTDGGDTWKPVPEIITTNGITDIFFLGSKFGWAVGLTNEIYKFIP